MFKKIISLITVFVFTTSILLTPKAEACWWKGMLYRVTGISGADPTRGGKNDNQRNQIADGDDIFLHNGDFMYRQEDIFIPSRSFGVKITHTYKAQSRFNGAFGLGWEMNYNKRVVPLANGDVVYFDGEGGESRFLYIDGVKYIPPQESSDDLIQNPDGTYTLTRKDGTKYNFNSTGTIAEIVDRNSNKLTFTHNPAGKLPIIGVPVYSNDPVTPRLIAYQFQLIKITDTAGRGIVFSYDENGRLVKLTDFIGREVNYTYDNFGHLISVTDPAGNITRYTYDSARNLRSIIDPKGNTYLTNTYNPNDQVIAQVFGNDTFYFSYDTEKKITNFTDRNGNKWVYYFNDEGNPIKIVDPKGNTTTKTYDTNKKMLLTSVIYPGGNSVEYEYASGTKGDPVRITRKPPTGSSEPPITTNFTYEPTYNFIKALTDPKGNVTTYNYDAKGNLLNIVYPAVGGLNPRVSFTYNQYGQVETVTDPKGTITKYEYASGTGYLIKTINDYGDEAHLNSTSVFTYDSAGNVASVTDSRGNTTNFEYNALNQLTRTIAPAPFNYETKYTYDQNGNLVKLERQSDAGGTNWQTTEYAYDIIDQLIKTKQYLAPNMLIETQCQYDANGNRSKVIDAEGNAIAYLYDGMNLLSQVTDALGNTTEYSYDKNGNLKAITDAKGNVTAYEYDGFDRLIKTTYSDSSYEEYAYDANANLTSKRTRKGDVISYSYDAINRMAQKTYPDNSGVSYTYDIASRLTSVIASPTQAGEAISYVYDNLNRVTQVTTATKIIGYEYDAVGNRTKLTYPDANYISYEYDQLNRLAAIKDTSNNNIASYSYDPLSRRAGLSYANGTSTAYAYDNLNRLTTLTNPSVLTNHTRTYTYDKVGNALSMATAEGTHTYTYDHIYQLTGVNYPPGYFASNATYTFDKVANRVNAEGKVYTSNNLNQYTSVSNSSLTYDHNGNLATNNDWTYSYDYENRLISAAKEATLSTYKYDAFGRRIEKQSSVDSQQSTERYVYDGDQLLCVYDSSGILQKKFAYGVGIDEPVIMEKSGQKYYYHFDRLGSVVGLTDQTGAKVEGYNYDAWGNVDNPSTVGNPYLYTGREYDSEIGLYYYRARYYSPQIGRFLQTDPVGYSDSMNLYQYCGNNSVNTLDPLGLCKGGWGSELAKWLDRTIDVAEQFYTQNPKVWIWNAFIYTTADVLNGTSDLLRLGEGWAAAEQYVSQRNYLMATAAACQDISRAASIFAIAASVTGLGKTAIKSDAAKPDAHNIIDYHRMKNQLAKQEIGYDIAGGKSGNVFRNAKVYAEKYGGNINDWVKKSGNSHTGAGGSRYQYHWVENQKTGVRLDFKLK